MQIVDKKSDFILKIWSKQPVFNEKKYRKLTYIREIDTKDGYLLFNLITGEMILLDADEKKKFKTPTDISDSFVLFLIKNWYLVPEDNNDLALSKKFDAISKMVNAVYTAPKISGFTILPTTDCNARCFYCYEHGCEKKFMSDKTAEDVVSYIMKNKADGYITLRWFGGEPLYNVKAIDYICNKLKANGVKFTSKMISNGYLFDSDMVERAKNTWKLKSVQITVDGTEEVYNRVKAFIYKDSVSPFRKVLDNAESLIKNEIRVDFRLNMDIHNIDNLFELADYLLQRFKDYEYFDIYPHLLYEDSTRPIGERDDEYLMQKYLELNKKVEVKTTKINPNTHVMKFKNHCMADTDTAIMILPDGKLGKCEHSLDDKFVGSIYDEQLDIKMINYFKTVSLPTPDCDECEVRPACVSSASCPERKTKCSKIDRTVYIKGLDDYILKVYKARKDEKNET